MPPKALCILLLSFTLHHLSAQTLSVLKEIQPGNASSYPSQLVVAGKTIWFAAGDATHGNELWQSNGKSNGTTMAFDLNPGIPGSYPGRLLYFNDALYFSANDGIHGYELYKTEGTLASTVQLTSTPVASPFGSLTPFFAYNGKVYFSFNDGVHGAELWSTDGTTAGTAMVKDLSTFASGTNPRDFFIYNNKLHFIGEAPGDTQALYVSDGTSQGTQQVFNCGEEGCSDFTLFNNKIFFISDDSQFSNPNLELYMSDGTMPGTGLFKEINNNGSGALRCLVKSGKNMYFVGNDGINGDELWKSDGTVNGTAMVKDIRPGSAGSAITEITPLKNKVIFEAHPQTGNGSLWISNGKSSGTMLLDTILPDLDPPSIKSLVSNGTMYFNGYLAGKGYELCTTDGTAAGTGLLFDIYPGIFSSSPAYFVKKGKKIYFTCTNDQSGTEVFVLSDLSLKSDGQATEAATPELISERQEDAVSHQPLLGQAFPSPAEDFTFIPLRLPADFQDGALAVVALPSGKQVLTMPVNAGDSFVTVPTNNLSQGTYLCVLQSGGQVMETGKFNVTR